MFRQRNLLPFMVFWESQRESINNKWTLHNFGIILLLPQLNTLWNLLGVLEFQGFNCLIYCLVVLKYCLIETLLNLFSLEVDPSCRLCSKPSFFNRVTRKRTHLCLLFASLALSVSLDIPLLCSHSFLFCPFSNSWPL